MSVAALHQQLVAHKAGHGAGSHGNGAAHHRPAVHGPAVHGPVPVHPAVVVWHVVRHVGVRVGPLHQRPGLRPPANRQRRVPGCRAAGHRLARDTGPQHAQQRHHTRWLLLCRAITSPGGLLLCRRARTGPRRLVAGCGRAVERDQRAAAPAEERRPLEGRLGVHIGVEARDRHLLKLRGEQLLLHGGQVGKVLRVVGRILPRRGKRGQTR